jgi:hypothetical protein
MHELFRIPRRGAGLGAALTLLLVGLVFSAGFGSSPALAQQEPPTPTPSDPIWRAFVEARDALEEAESLDLTYVQSYTFEQTEFQYGIDDCDSDIFIVDYRPIYFGWTFRITTLRGVTYQVRVSFDTDDVVICDEVTESSAPTVVEGTPDPSLPQPVAGSGATGAFEIGGHILGLGQPTIDAMNQSGMTWAKKQLRWSLGDGTGGAQSMISDAQGKGFKILLGIVGIPGQMGDFETYIQRFATFVGEVAALGPDAIEVWNEPNLEFEWPSGQINGANYTRLLAAAFNAIKTANPNVMVISGAPAPTGFFGAAGCSAAGCNDDVFMQQMAQAGAGSYMDCIGLHYNEGIVSPATNSGDPRGEYPTYYLGSMLQRGYGLFGGKPACFTELGYLTPEGFGTPLPGNFAWAANTTVAQHAAWLADAASRLAQSGHVRLMIVWNVNFTIYGSDPQGAYAIIRPDGGCPACSTLGSVMRG